MSAFSVQEAVLPVGPVIGRSRGLFTALVAISLAGCVSLPKPEAPKPPKAPAGFPMHIAVLPLVNNTSDSEGPILVRAFAIRKLSRELGYIVPPADQTDATLASRDLIWAGHPQGHQMLIKQDPVPLAYGLGVEGLLYGELKDYSSYTASVFSEKKVAVHFWLTDAAGKKVWESTSGSIDSKGISAGAPSMDNILSEGSLPPEIQDRVRRSALAPDAFEAVDAAFSDFPRRY